MEWKFSYTFCVDDKNYRVPSLCSALADDLTIDMLNLEDSN